MKIQIVKYKLQMAGMSWIRLKWAGIYAGMGRDGLEKARISWNGLEQAEMGGNEQK